jgi:hypothetical protein
MPFLSDKDREAWLSPESYFAWKQTPPALFALLAGSVILLISVYVLAGQWYFYHNSVAVVAPIVEVLHDYFPAGKGSALTFKPVVAMADGGKIAVDTTNAENIYALGTKMSLRCDLSSKVCKPDKFLDLWFGVVGLAIAVFLLVSSLLILRRARNTSSPATNQN